ncbi:MAG: DUF2442 domain-containing protein [Sphingobacteriia bacterium]|nr:DUF2442 domain-containing protein [Sphingobacteriia bacterium]
MNPAIVKVIPAEDFRLMLSFVNGEVRRFDMKPYLDNGLFAQLKDKGIFESVKVTFDTIEWSNKLDFDPEVLYEKSTPL